MLLKYKKNHSTVQVKVTSTGPRQCEMWTLAVLWATMAAAAAGPTDWGRRSDQLEGCVPSIRLNGTADGSRTLLLEVRPSPSCHCQRLDIAHQPRQGPDGRGHPGWRRHRLHSTWKVPGLQALEAAPGHLLSRATVQLGGWYFALCCEADGGPCYREQPGELWVDGINYDTWNVSILAKQASFDPPRLHAEVTNQLDPSRPSIEPKLYFPQLFITLRNKTSRYLIETATVGYPNRTERHSWHVFGGERGLVPGVYVVQVRPRYLLCGGSCIQREVPVTVTPPPEQLRVGQVAVDTSAPRTVYLVLGVLVGLAIVSLAALLSYSFLCNRRDRPWLSNIHKLPLPSSRGPAVPVSVLLLYRGGGGGALDQLRSALRAAGIILLDARERSVLNLMQTYASPADLLALETFREAYLLFVSGGDDAPAASVPAQIYDSVLRFVRNGRLGLDYGRVFVATLGESAGAELAGLVEGRLFRLPGDVSLLIEHLLCTRRRPAVARQCSVESRVDLLPAMVPSPESADPDPRPAPV